MMKYLFFIIGLLASTSSFAQTEEKNTDDKISVDTIYSQLPEMMVTGERPVAKLDKGALSFDMPLLLKRLPADNAYEALGNIPGINVSDEEIKFGAQSVTLIINGKATTLDAGQVADRLKQMPADRLAKAEVMMSAPARFHVRGAVINIVTKDYAGGHQTSGQVQGKYTQSKYGSGQLAGNLLHVNNRLTIDAGYTYSYGAGYGEVEHEAQHPLEEGRVSYYDLTTNKSDYISHKYRIGADYKFAENHLMSLAYTGYWTSTSSNNNTTGNSVSTQRGKDHTYLHNVDFSYNLPFNLQITASYTHYENPQDQYLDGSMFETARNLIAKSEQKIDKWLVAADQTHTLKNGWGISYGAKAQFVTNKSYQTTQTPEGEIQAEATSTVDIDERIVDAYWGFSKQIGQTLSLDASATAEYYHSPQWNKWRVFPTLNATWSMDERNILNLSFSSNANYPSYWSTMSSVYYSSTYSEIWGNPGLTPSSSYDVSLMWQLNRKYTFVAFANFDPDYFVQLPYQTSDRMAVIMKEVNFNHHNTFGIQASAQYSAGTWLNGNVFLTGIYVNDKCNDFFDLSFDRSKMAVIAGGTASARLSKKENIRFMLSPFFQSDAIQGVYDIKNVFTLNASLRWSSANDKWNISLEGKNLTNRRYDTRSVYGNQDYGMKVCTDWINGSLSVVYKFGNYKQKKTSDVDTSRMGH